MTVLHEIYIPILAYEGFSIFGLSEGLRVTIMVYLLSQGTSIERVRVSTRRNAPQCFVKLSFS